MADERDTALAFLEDLALRLAKGTLDLPPCPQIALKIREILGRDDASADQVARLALLDPVLTARILKLANSAAFTRSGSATTDIKAAIGRVGFDLVKSLAFDIALEQTFELKATSHLRALNRAIRAHSRHVAVLAYFLARQYARGLKSDAAMLAGLLHEIGKLYILARADRYPDLFPDTDEIEQLLNEWHTGISHAIVDAWELPESVVTAIEEQNAIDLVRRGSVTVSEVLITATLLSQASPVDTDDRVQVLMRVPSFLRLNLGESACRALMTRTRALVDSVGAALPA